MARAGTIPCVGGGAAPVVLRAFTARPRSAHYGWEKRVRGAGLLLCRVWGGAGRVILRQTFVFGGQDTPAACTNPGKVLLWRGGCLWRSRVLALSFFPRSEIFPLLRKHKKQPAKHGIVCLLSFAGAVGGAVFINFG